MTTHDRFKIGIVYWLLLALVAGLYIYRIFILFKYNLGIEDFKIFWGFAKAFTLIGQIYQPDLTRYEPTAPLYKFPPLYGSILVIFIKNGIAEETIKLWFGILQVFAFYLSAYLCVLAIRHPDKKSVYVILTPITLLLTPLLEWNLYFLQLEAVVLLLLSLSFVCVARKKYFLAGIMIGLAGALKIYPLVLGAFLIIKKRWPALAGMIIAVLIASIFSICVLGLEQNHFFYFSVLPVLLNENPIPAIQSYNLSIPGFLTYWGMEPQSSKLAGTIFLLTGFVFLVCIFNWKKNILRDDDKNNGDVLELLALLLIVLLAMPNCWWNYQLLLIIPLLSTVALLSWQDNINRYMTIAVISCGALFIYSITLHTGYLYLHHGESIFFYYIRLITPILLLAIIINIHLRSLSSSIFRDDVLR